ncbi:MAG: DUF1679 domain-containing protein [Balneolaceae bacterium]|nr:DUF1679 domain-containing protein [Balneolaceae bacterium]
MNDYFKSIILESTGATSLLQKERIQELWSGYGEIMRFGLKGAEMENVIVKHVQLQNKNDHPRGWNTDIGHQRKLKSYEVETTWYENFSARSIARLPHCLNIAKQGDEVLIVMEDLDEAGFDLRKSYVSWDEITECLKWLAQFHASFMDVEPTGLWETGTYWHLDTRPQELEALSDHNLKIAAPLIDQKLNACNYKTFVHGDAKLANFCFSKDGKVAGVDFQYVGGGCGMKDVAYFIGSCLNEDDCERLEDQILDTYFGFLNQELGSKAHEIETEWAPLYRVAWADFHRFLKGWSPGHWKINSYSERITKEVINQL